MKTKKMLDKLLKQKRGMVGIEAAIVLIAFVIVAAAFSFMVVNMGLFSTQRGRETIQQGVSEASSPLTLDGSIHIWVNVSETAVVGFVAPLKTLGVRYVPMHSPETEVTVRVENKTIFADIYSGIIPLADANPTGNLMDELIDNVTASMATTGWADQANLFIGNSDGDSSLDYDEKGYMVFVLDTSNAAAERERVFIEIRPEKGAPLTIEFIIPPQLTEGWHTIGS
jgi:flagellin FlaB